MAKINLLPWREALRKERNQKTKALFAGAAVFAVIIVAFVNWRYDAMITGQLVRNKYLQDEISAVDLRLKEITGLEAERARLLQRKKVIEELQGSRSQSVHLFDELVRVTPEGVRLTSVKQSGGALVLEGLAESYARVSEYMRAIEGSDWVGSPEIKIVEAKGGDPHGRYLFTLQIKLKNGEA